MEERQDRDHELVELILAGNREAFGELVERHQQLVAATAWRYGMPREDIEDVVSEVFIKVYEALPRYRPEHRFSTWLYRVGANHVMDRARRTRREHLGETSTVPDTLPDRGEAIPTLLVKDERQRLLRAGIARLNPALREILFLVSVEGRRVDEACRMLGIPIGTGKVRLMRARNALKNDLLRRHPGYFGA